MQDEWLYAKLLTTVKMGALLIVMHGLNRGYLSR